MTEFFQKHLKLIIVIAALSFLLIGIILFLTRSKTQSEVPAVTKDGLIIDATNHYLEDSQISKDDKYLMLLAQESIENFGTQQLGNSGPLYDLLNQSTPSFSTVVQKRINLVSKTVDLATVSDPSSIKLTRIGENEVSVLIDATTTNNINKTSAKHRYTVNLNKQGDYWLVDNIIEQNI